jgi:ADP-heptose:LPS heptosyltransferase
LVEHWRRQLGAPSGFNVGITWKGSSQNPLDRFRSIPLSWFEALARVEGVQLISLQKGEGREELQTIVDRFSVVDLGGIRDEASRSLMDTAAIMQCLDLVVLCDSAPLHLAGALAVPAWAPLPVGPDWRWLLGRDDSPWYPSVRLFRQTRFDDWQEVFTRLASALREQVRQPMNDIPLPP